MEVLPTELRDRIEYSPVTSSSTPARVLVVDDDAQERNDLAKILTSLGYVPEMAQDGEEALEKIGAGPVDAIVTDLMMPRMDGYTLLQTLLSRGDLTPAVVLTGLGSIREAMAIVHDLRAFWFLEKPAQQAVLAPLLERAIRQKRLMAETERLQRQLSLHGVLGDMVGTSESMRRVFSLIQQVAPKTASVLISGESGTGKERVAAAIHKLSPRAGGPFIAINCAAIPESLIESELFGHEKGAFTGAIGRQAGCFEHASGGTLFLDEIAEMPMPMQAKLLRVLEESKVRRLGRARRDFGRCSGACGDQSALGRSSRKETTARRSILSPQCLQYPSAAAAPSKRRHPGDFGSADPHFEPAERLPRDSSRFRRSACADEPLLARQYPRIAEYFGTSCDYRPRGRALPVSFPARLQSAPAGSHGVFARLRHPPRSLLR